MALDVPTAGSALTAEAAAIGDERTAVPPSFVVDLFGRVPAEDLASYSPEGWPTSSPPPSSTCARRADAGPDLRFSDLEIERRAAAAT